MTEATTETMTDTTTDKIPVSILTISLNEEANIARCLESLKRFDEVWLVDSNSTDRTREIAESMGAKVVTFEWNRQYPKKKQWAFENLPFANKWVMLVDADEQVPDALAQEIADTLARDGDKHAGYFFGFDYFFAGKMLKHGQRIYKLALMQHAKTRWQEYDDLEVKVLGDNEMHYQPPVDGTTGVLENRMVHEDQETLYHFFDRHNKYSDWEVVVRHNGSYFRNEDAQPFLRRFTKPLFGRMPFKPAIVFLYSYVLRAGFLDGRAGLDFALARAFHFWQVGLKMRERIRNVGPPKR
jgi:glycosyltransferase involved in cell wall biosynthesis